MAAVPHPARRPSADRAARLFEGHGRTVFAFCLTRLGDRRDAEDATQATFLNAFRSLERGVEPRLESAWLLTIANRVVLNRRRAASRRRRVEAPMDHELEQRVAAHEAETDELMQLRQALAALPDQQRVALLLREWQGPSFKEVAAGARGSGPPPPEPRAVRGSLVTAVPRSQRAAPRVAEGPWPAVTQPSLAPLNQGGADVDADGVPTQEPDAGRPETPGRGAREDAPQERSPGNSVAAGPPPDVPGADAPGHGPRGAGVPDPPAAAPPDAGPPAPAPASAATQT